MGAKNLATEQVAINDELQFPASSGKGPLINPIVDFLMIGGLSLVFFTITYFFIKQNESVHRISWTMFYLSFAINSPHFLISYLHFYRDHKDKVLASSAWIGVGIGVPLALASMMFFSVMTKQYSLIGRIVNLMFFLVGWHYVKQIFGCIVVTASRYDVGLTTMMRRTLKANLFSLWALSYFSMNQSVAQLDFYSVKYFTFAFPKLCIDISYIFVGLSLIAYFYSCIKSYIETGRTLPFISWTAFASIYAWYIPAIHHPIYFYMIPAFHSLQYLLFSLTFAKNKSFHDAREKHQDVKALRAGFVKNFLFYLAFAVIFGALFFEFLPKGLDKAFPMGKVAMATGFLACFQLFINVHHYFIDHLIWRGSHPEVKKYLLGK